MRGARSTAHVDEEARMAIVPGEGRLECEGEEGVCAESVRAEINRDQLDRAKSAEQSIFVIPIRTEEREEEVANHGHDEADREQRGQAQLGLE